MFYCRKFKSKYDLGSSSFAQRGLILWMRSLSMIFNFKKAAHIFLNTLIFRVTLGVKVNLRHFNPHLYSSKNSVAVHFIKQLMNQLP